MRALLLVVCLILTAQDADTRALLQLEDAWATALVANTAATIKTIAPTRSNQRARLNSSHHSATSKAPATPPSMPMGPASGATTGAPNITSNWTLAINTAGHSRKGFRLVIWLFH